MARAKIALICLSILGLIISALKDGEEKGKHNFNLSLVSAIIVAILYYYAGILTFE